MATPLPSLALADITEHWLISSTPELTPRPPPPERRPTSIDPVGAFFPLILYHVGMFYARGFHEVALSGAALEPPMPITNLAADLLFLVSGAATGSGIYRRARKIGQGVDGAAAAFPSW